MRQHSVSKLMTHSSGSQDDMNKSTSDYVFWKINTGRGRQRRGNKNEGDAVKVHLFLMKYKTLWLCMFFCMDWPWGTLAHLQGFNTTDTYNIITINFPKHNHLCSLISSWYSDLCFLQKTLSTLESVWKVKRVKGFENCMNGLEN